MSVTLADIKASRIPQSLGLLPNDPRVVQYVNEAQERLIDQGRWWTTIQRIQLCVNEGCIAWPRGVQNIEQVAVCGVPIEMRNQWYEFVPGLGNIQQCDGCGTCGQPWPGWGVPSLASNMPCGHLAWYDHGTSPTWYSVHGPNKKIRVYLSNLADAGKKILFQGIDDNNIEIRNEYAGAYINGEYLTLANPFVTSNAKFSAITGVQKENTAGRVLVYEFDTITSSERLLAIYDPDEPNPSYRRSFIPGMAQNFGCTSNCTEGTRTKTITALVKLGHIPVKVDTDWLVISSIPALKEMCMSILKEEKNETAEAEALRKKSIRTLNDQLRSYTGDRTTIWTQGQPRGSMRRLQTL